MARSRNMRTGLRDMPLVTTAASTRVLLEGTSLPRMAPNLAESQHAQIRDMILSNRRRFLLASSTCRQLADTSPNRLTEDTFWLP